MSLVRRYGWVVLLGFVPVAILLEWLTPANHTAVFVTSVLAILPLAAMIGRATDVLADRLGGGIGGLLNATFGNAAELIIGALALREGLIDRYTVPVNGPPAAGSGLARSAPADVRRRY